MERKSFVIPSQYPLGGPLEHTPVAGFESIIVNATGFQGVELLHTSKMITLMGAKYDEMFKPSTTVLICKTFDPNSQKIRHAEGWGIPIVAATWLWSCIKSCQLRPFKDYLLGKAAQDQSKARGLTRQDKIRQDLQTEAERQEQEESSLPAKELFNDRKHQEPSGKAQPASDEEASTADTEPITWRATRADANNFAQHEREQDQQASISEEIPPGEISANSPPKPRAPSTQKKKPLFRSFDGNESLLVTEPEKQQFAAVPEGFESLKPTEVVQNAQSINGAIQDLLNMKTRAKSNTSSNTDISSKKKFNGRALSNLSNSSIGSNVLASRASSVDSLNTDGVGSQIAAETSQPNGTRGSFTGRAKPRRPSALVELGGAGPPFEDFFVPDEEEASPQQTQLGYEDDEEAILLREKLAERRRDMIREGQVDVRAEDKQDKRGRQVRDQKRIKDDDALLGGRSGGWGAGWRTRKKDTNSKGLLEF
jgi:DNA replication regulator DPB11